MFDQASKEWLNCEITYSGDTWEQKLLSVRKKFYRHKESEFHSKAVKIVEESEHKTIETIVLKNISTSKAIRSKIFRTVYKIVLTNQSFNSMESEIDLQELNGLDMGRIYSIPLMPAPILLIILFMKCEKNLFLK